MVTPERWPWLCWAQREPNRVALTIGSRAYLWPQLAERIEALAVGFHSQGVHVGSGVMLQTDNSERAVLSYLALLRCGARLMPVNPQLPLCQTAALLPFCNIDFALTLAGEAPENIPALKITPQAGWLQHRWQPDAIATLTLTSGSTALPKAAAHTFTAHLASAAGVVAKLGFSADDRWLLSLPLFHVSGQGILWRWLYRGGTLVVAESKERVEATFASLVPTQLWRLLRQPETGLRSVLLGGAAIPQRLTAQAEARGILCWCGYGMTETASTITAKRADGLPGVGRPLDGHHLRLVNGEIQLRSAALACGYWRGGELHPLVDKEGWFHTRDGGSWAKEGLIIKGRLDNLFFSAGEGIQPEQTEAILARHPAVKQIFIVPVEDEEYGHRPVALVTLDSKCSLVELQCWAMDKLAGFQRPVRWYALPEMANGSIKISRKQLADWVARQKNSGPENAVR